MNPIFQPPPIWKFRGCGKKIVNDSALPNFFRNELDRGNSPNIMCVGKPNIGKSETMIRLCQGITKEFNLKDDIVFTLSEFWDKIDIGKNRPYRIKLLDDFGSEFDSTRSMTKEIRDIIHYLQTFRTDGLAIVLTTPVKGFINKDYRDRIADYFIELRSKNEAFGYAQGIIHHIQRNNSIDRTYRHNLHIDVNGIVNNRERGIKIWGWIFYPPSKEVHLEYLPIREAKNELNKQKGKENNKAKDDNEKTDEDIIRNVLNNKTTYIKTTKNGTQKLNRNLISFNESLHDDRRLKRICAKIEADLKI